MDEQTVTEDHTSSPRAWLRPVLVPLKPLFRDVAFASLFVNLLALAAPVFVMQVYDRVVAHAGLSTLAGLSLGMVIVVAFDFILRQVRSRLMQAVAVQIDVWVGRSLFETVMALPLRTLEMHSLGYWQQAFRDLDVVRNTLSGSSAILVFDIPYALFYIGIIFIIAYPVAWVLLLSLLIYSLLSWLSGRFITAAARRERGSLHTRDTLMAETIMGRATIKSLSLVDTLRPRWEERQAEAIEQSLQRGIFNDRFVNLGQMFSVMTSVSMTAVGALSILEQTMTMGGLVAANMLSGRLLSPLNQLVGAWRTYSGFLQSVERLGKVFAMQKDRMTSLIQLPPPSGLFRLEKVCFRYSEQGKPILDDVSAEIAPGGMTAIMGRNGCGKSTLLKALLGLYPLSSGRILLDNADIAQFSRHDMAKWMGYVPQECVLFAGTIRDNIVQGCSEATDEQILAAAQAAGVHQFVMDLPDGYGTIVGESGAMLSGGMRQRIAIARALIGSPPVLLMDEPSGSLDRHAEEHLRRTLVEIAKTRTVIIVTHSPVLLQACRSIIVMEAGKIACMGPAAEVLRFLAQSATQSAAQPQAAGQKNGVSLSPVAAGGMTS